MLYVSKMGLKSTFICPAINFFEATALQKTRNFSQEEDKGTLIMPK
jgi:hypothetical protein